MDLIYAKDTTLAGELLYVRGQKNKPPFLEDLPSIIAGPLLSCQPFVRKPVECIANRDGQQLRPTTSKSDRWLGDVIYCTPDT